MVPSLCEALAACGFEDETGKGSKRQHNAATDSVRMMALLMSLLRLGDGQKLEIQCSSHKAHPRIWRKDPVAQRVWNRRPVPKELFPYTAKVSCETGFSNLQTESLLDLFAIHKPVAVGLSKDKKRGWVCLSTLRDLEEYTQKVDGSVIRGSVWAAVSIHDTAVIPAQGLAELREIRREKLHAQADEKRAQRRQRKEDESVCLDPMEYVGDGAY